REGDEEQQIRMEEKNAPQTEEEIQEYAMEDGPVVPVTQKGKRKGRPGYISHEKIDIIGVQETIKQDFSNK
ncbi:hypothetical protein ACJX0J_040026, partial [Zea mays]